MKWFEDPTSALWDSERLCCSVAQRVLCIARAVTMSPTSTTLLTAEALSRCFGRVLDQPWPPMRTQHTLNCRRLATLALWIPSPGPVVLTMDGCCVTEHVETTARTIEAAHLRYGKNKQLGSALHGHDAPGALKTKPSTGGSGRDTASGDPFLAQSDVEVCFYQYRLPRHLRRFFGLTRTERNFSKSPPPTSSPSCGITSNDALDSGATGVESGWWRSFRPATNTRAGSAPGKLRAGSPCLGRGGLGTAKLGRLMSRVTQLPRDTHGGGDHNSQGPRALWCFSVWRQPWRQSSAKQVLSP